MTYKIESAFAEGLLTVRIAGTVAADNVSRLAQEVIALADQHRADRVFSDVRELVQYVEPVATLNLVQRYPTDKLSRTRRVAVLELPGQHDAHHFHETAARNRGYDIRHFTDRGEAERWLGNG